MSTNEAEFMNINRPLANEVLRVEYVSRVEAWVMRHSGRLI